MQLHLDKFYYTSSVIGMNDYKTVNFVTVMETYRSQRVRK